jgi:hypothetical protein
MSTASRIGSGNPNTSASTAKYRVLSTALPSSGSSITLTKLSKPTNDDVMRFVFWKAITNDCTIGDQLKITNTMSIGATKIRLESPPPCSHVRGVCRRLRR